MLIFLFHYLFYVPPVYVFNSYHSARIRSFLHHKEGITAVIIGNSRTRYAIPLQAKDSIGFNYLRIVRLGSRILTFQQIVEEICRNNPDFLLIQSDFFLEDSKPIIPEFKRTVVRYLFQKDKLNSDWLETQFFTSPALDCEIPQRKADQTELNEKVEFLFSELKTKSVRSDLFVHLLRLAENSKTKIVFVDVPIAKRLADTIQSAEVMRENQRFINAVSDGKKVINLTFQSNFPDSLYFDFTHFNVQGRKVYFNQFIQKMDSLISGEK